MIYTLISKIYHNSPKKKVIIRRGAVANPACIFEGANRIGDESHLTNCTVGYGSYLGRNCFFVDVRIGKYCSIGSNIITTSGLHPSRKFVSTHSAFYSTRGEAGLSYVDQDRFSEHMPADPSRITIGNDVWICDGAIILEGIKIGDGAIIAAGAVVTRDVPPYAVVGGTPAQVLRFRFEEEEINYLLRVQWWNKGEKWIKKNAGFFDDIKNFREKIGEC